MSNNVLSTAMRPTTLSGLFGQDKTVAAIRKHMTGKRPPSVWLFSGEAGSGKTTLARILNTAYNCTHMKLWGDPCKECTAATWALHEVNAAEHSGVAEMESVIRLMDHKPMVGSKRVAIIDECHALSAQGWKSLLKPTEDVPDHAVWIFCTSDLRKVPAANQRRPVKYGLRLLTFNDAEQFLRKYAAKAEIKEPLESLIEAVHTLGVGSPGVLLQALEKYGAGNAAVDSIADTDGAGVDAYRLCKALTAGQWQPVAAILRDTTPDSARMLRAFVSAWLKGGLTKMKLPTRLQEAAALGLIELAAAPYEDAAMHNWLVGVLWKICRRYAKQQDSARN